VISKLGFAGIGSVVNSALSPGDSEESTFSPLGSPGVSTEPVVESVFLTPTEDLDGVSTSHSTGGVLIDSTFVLEEILIDGESSFHWSVAEDFGLDLRWGGGFDDGTSSASVWGEG